MSGPQVQPKVSGWLALQQPFAFDSEHFPLRKDIGRLQNGTPGIQEVERAAVQGLVDAYETRRFTETTPDLKADA